jgi:photosystem II stability/assembly factor-like uncharacterized protein
MILIGTDAGIYRWIEGMGWPVLHALQERPIIGLAAPGLGVLVAMDRTGAVLESTNNGMDWRALPLPAGVTRPTALTVLGSPPTIVVGVRPMALYQRRVGAPSPVVRERKGAWLGRARELADSATALLAPRQTRKSPSAEEIRLAGWLPLNPPPAPRTTVPTEVRSIVGLGGSPSVWLATVNNAGLWRTDDQGRTWSQVPGPHAEVHAVRGVPGKPAEVWAATSDGVWFSDDAGASWTERGAGLEAVRQVRAIAINPADPKNLLAGAAPLPIGDAAPVQGLGYALHESLDAGKTWTKVVKRNFPEALDYDTISDIRFDPAAPENILAALGSGELWVTRNGGAYWGPLARQIQAVRVLRAVS